MKKDTLQAHLDTIERNILSIGGKLRLMALLGQVAPVAKESITQCENELGEMISATLQVKQGLGLQSNLREISEEEASDESGIT